MGYARALINYTFMTLDISNCVKSLTYNFSAETLENYLSPLLFQSLEEIYGLSIRTLRMQILKLV
jgi:hypothetical protein